MAAVEQLYAPPKPEVRALKRIRFLSLPFQIAFAGVALFQAGMLALAAIVLVLSDGQAMRVHPQGVMLTTSTDPATWPTGSVALGDLPLLSQVYGGAVLFVLVASQVAAFACLFKLFGSYRRGVVFAAPTMAWMRRAGALFIFTAVAPAALQPITQALGLLDSNWLNGRAVGSLLAGAALFVLAYVIELGREIESEGKGYV